MIYGFEGKVIKSVVNFSLFSFGLLTRGSQLSHLGMLQQPYGECMW